jgi:decaprenylphospho-beta-D-erythro-pentofuranosid-2-ulose 2-reductase
VQSVLVLGGTSEIGVATAKRLVRERARRVILAVRDTAAAEGPAAELRALGAEVHAVGFDALDTDSHSDFLHDVFARFGDIDLVLFAWGVLGDQDWLATDHDAAVEAAQINYTGVVSVSIPLRYWLAKQGHGTIVYLSSVAGERARASNFVYGSTKAGMDAFAQGLGDSLANSGVRVMVVRPGFVKTKMTEGLDPVPLSTDADAVAESIATGLRRSSHTVWSPTPLRFVMSALRHLPRAVFRKLDL